MVIVSAGGALAVAIFLLIVILSPTDDDLAARAKCDEAVGALLTSKDMVEVTRAGILVETLHCSVARRLPRV